MLGCAGVRGGARRAVVGKSTRAIMGVAPGDLHCGVPRAKDTHSQHTPPPFPGGFQRDWSCILALAPLGTRVWYPTSGLILPRGSRLASPLALCHLLPGCSLLALGPLLPGDQQGPDAHLAAAPSRPRSPCLGHGDWDTGQRPGEEPDSLQGRR